MSDYLFSWVLTYGGPILFFTTFLGCFAMPVPSSLMMLSGGAFAASGDIALTTVVFAAGAGAILGDQAAFAVGKGGRNWLEAYVSIRPKRAEMLSKAQTFTEAWGGHGVFYSRWLMSPIGPYVNFVGGAVEMPWLRFAFWAALGEVIWVIIYVGLGFTFSSKISEIADILGDVIGLITALAVTLGLGYALMKANAKAPVDLTKPEDEL